MISSPFPPVCHSEQAFLQRSGCFSHCIVIHTLLTLLGYHLLNINSVDGEDYLKKNHHNSIQSS